jgi:transposase InsO family protein
MREMGLAAVQPRAYKRTTVPGNAPVAAPDLLERDFTADAPGQRLVGDITYLCTGEGWLYLATVIDLATRMVVGWQTAAHMRTALVTDALQMAIDAGHVGADAIFHSDRGTQYTSAEFDAFTTKNRIRRSRGRTGACWDNAAAESFFATLENANLQVKEGLEGYEIASPFRRTDVLQCHGGCDGIADRGTHHRGWPFRAERDSSLGRGFEPHPPHLCDVWCSA